jgi:hypothetical protein
MATLDGLSTSSHVENSLQFEPHTGHQVVPAPEIDLRDRPFPSMGLVVDAGVAAALGLEFLNDESYGVAYAQTQSAEGVEVHVVARPESYRILVPLAIRSTIEALANRGVRQIVALSHTLVRLSGGDSGPSDRDGLTFGLITRRACSRLLAASLRAIEDNPSPDGCFVRDLDDDTNVVAQHELRQAVSSGSCICVMEATTLRSASEGASEAALAELLLRIPDAVSPLAACFCQRTSV